MPLLSPSPLAPDVGVLTIPVDPVGGIVIDRVIPAADVAGGIVLWPGKAPGPALAPLVSVERDGNALAPDMGGVLDDLFDG